MFRKLVYRLSLLFAIAQVVLILASWLLSTALPDVPMRSLLSPGGIRWFFGSFASNLGSPYIIYLLVTAIAWGSVSAGGLWSSLVRYLTGRRFDLTSQQRFALSAAGLMLFLETVVILGLTVMPHAVLLSITGELFPSSFSEGLIPTLAFMATTAAVVYGLLSGRFRGLFDVGQCMTSAGEWVMPLILLYIMGAQFIHQLLYVFME